MVMNIGLLALILLIVIYIVIFALFRKSSYLEAVRMSYSKMLGGEWTTRKRFAVEAGTAIIVIILVSFLTYLAAP